MIHYHISSLNPNSHFLNIEMTIPAIKSQFIEVQLPAWRPGRYELQHFAKNIAEFAVVDQNNLDVAFYKIKKDRWKISTNGNAVKLNYTYYANILNAGSSFVDDTQCYINFVNCLPYVEGRINEACSLTLDLPLHYKIACGLKETGKFSFQAQDYYELVDCPMMASATLQHHVYKVENSPETNFHIWIQGNYFPDIELLKSDFSKFTKFQLDLFGQIPCVDYHFLIQVLPVPYYHGVEHRNSTVIVLGPDSNAASFYPDLLGVCSHELYHTWNICKIRPKEMLPYDFTQENYFYTGFVAEGVTTYLGDLILAQSGVINEESYLLELEANLKKHFEKDGFAFQSLAESSFDLWLDGYVMAIPNRRVSIYSKGALIALILDLKIRKKTDNNKSIHDVMFLMWQRFGKPFVGYEVTDYQVIAEEIYDENLSNYFDECLWKNISLLDQLNDQLAWVGLRFEVQQDQSCRMVVLDANNKTRQKWLNCK